MLELQRKALQPHLDLLILILLAVSCYVFFFHGLGNIGFLGPDEPRYASIAAEMYRTGDYITPRLNGMPWFEKPVLMYWGAAIGYAIFGVGEFGARLPSALAATLCVFFVYFAGRRLWDRTAGVLAALVMASSIGFFAFARAASMDMLLTATLTIALCSFLTATNSKGADQRRWFMVFYASLGFGALAKGPIAFVLPGASLFAFLFFRRRLSDWKTFHPGLSWITVAIAAPWYIACTWKNGPIFLQEFFLNHNFRRFTTNLYAHPHAFYFYLPVLLMLTLPWTFLMISALRRRFDSTDALLAWWIVLPIVFFSFSWSKLPGYILPVVPPFAMLCAKELRRERSRLFKIGTFIQAGTMIFIGVAFGFFGELLSIDPHVNGMLIAAVTVVIAAVLVVVGLWLKPQVLAGFNLFTMFLLVLFSVTLVVPRFDLTDTMRPWSKALKSLVTDQQIVYLYKPQRSDEFGLGFYRAGKVAVINSANEMVDLTGSEKEVFCITDNKTLDEVAHIAKVDMKIMQSLGNQTAFLAWRSK
jgi:4-amino-4-deoxy-L-arabinose transferase-like glycosyltransferase